VIHRNLNPEWNESFSFKSSTLDVPLRVRVYDHDYGSLDDFMGGQTVDLASFANEE
jgi:Ca2+-dependent lipid-binding protein